VVIFMAALTVGVRHSGAMADPGPGGWPSVRTTGPAGGDRSAAVSSGTRTVRSWPLLVLAVPAAAEVWSGWLEMRYGSVELKASQASAAVSQASPRRYHSIAEFMSGAMVAAS
jgi:hypothetical protein